MADSAVLQIRVTPKSSRNRILWKDGILRVYVTAPPVDGEANAAVIQVLAKHFKLPKSSIDITKGHSTRDKTIVIQGLSYDDVVAMMDQRELF